MFELRTRCGRSITLTGDHNLWVLRNGMPTLIRTDEALQTDYLPVPLELQATGDLHELDVLPYLVDTTLSVFAEESVLEYVANGGQTDFVAVMRASGVNPHAKLFAIRKRIRGRGIKVKQFIRLGLYKTGKATGWRVGGKLDRCRLPAVLPLTDDVLRLFGYYVAEGNAQRRYIVLANRHPVLRAAHRGVAVRALEFLLTSAPSTDYTVSFDGAHASARRGLRQQGGRKAPPGLLAATGDAALGRCCGRTLTATARSAPKEK